MGNRLVSRTVSAQRQLQRFAFHFKLWVYRLIGSSQADLCLLNEPVLCRRVQDGAVRVEPRSHGRGNPSYAPPDSSAGHSLSESSVEV